MPYKDIYCNMWFQIFFTSFPCFWYPYSTRSLEILATFTASLNGVASPISPLLQPTLNLISLDFKFLTILWFSNLALKALDQVTNGHSGGDGVGVDDDVRGDALACEDHVLLPGKIKIININLISQKVKTHLYWIPQVPFCPCLEANLSPICGILALLTYTAFPSQYLDMLIWV